MNSMFYKAGTSTTELDFSNFDTRKVQNMEEMFSRTAMTKLDLSSFDFQSVTSTHRMFFESGSLTEILFSPSEAPNLSTTNMMFMRCYHLETLEFPLYNTPNLTNVSSMFWDYALYADSISLDFSSADFDTFTTYSGMFGIPKKAKIYLKDTQTNRDFMSTNFPSLTPTYVTQP